MGNELVEVSRSETEAMADSRLQETTGLKGGLTPPPLTSGAGTGRMYRFEL